MVSTFHSLLEAHVRIHDQIVQEYEQGQLYLERALATDSKAQKLKWVAKAKRHEKQAEQYEYVIAALYCSALCDPLFDPPPILDGLGVDLDVDD